MSDFWKKPIAETRSSDRWFDQAQISENVAKQCDREGKPGDAQTWRAARDRDEARGAYQKVRGK